MTVKPCNCESNFQDKEYGKGKRIHTVSADGTKAHCTVCEGSGKNAKRNTKLGQLTSSARKYKSN